jgi:hypothetical protein
MWKGSDVWFCLDCGEGLYQYLARWKEYPRLRKEDLSERLDAATTLRHNADPFVLASLSDLWRPWDDCRGCSPAVPPILSLLDR